MDIFKQFDKDVYWIQDEFENRVRQYPELLKRQGLNFMEKHKAFKEQNERNGICYLLPFWIRDAFGIDMETCKRISLGNAFGIFYFFVMDEIMDVADGEYKGSLLPLGNMFLVDLIAQYRNILPVEPGFWRYFDRFMEEWASSVQWEREEHWGKFRLFHEDDFLKIARKAAPLKLCCIAMAYLAGRLSDIENLFDTIDYTLVAFQLIDDWRDWREDMYKGNCTYFLSLVMKYCGLDNPGQLNEAYVKKAIYIGNVLNEIFITEKKYTKLAVESLSGFHAPYLETYIERQSEYFKCLKEEIEFEAGRMLKGGINSIL